MKLPFKIICTDFDGTLHADSENPPVPYHLQALIAGLQAQGAKWVINTGRDFTGLLAVMDEARLSIQPDYLVAVEREIHRRDGTGYIEHALWNRQCIADQAQLFERVRPAMPALKRWIQSRFEANVFDDLYSPFCLVAKSNADADVILEYVQAAFQHEPDLTIVRNDIYARFSHGAYNKGTALGEVARLERVGRDQVFAAGDHWNDLPMLTVECAGWVAAPANAIPEVKAAVLARAGFISRYACGHGVAQGLTHYLELRDEIAADPAAA